MDNSSLKQRVFLLLHRFGLKVGLQIVPNHYYSSIANINELKRRRGIWAKRSSMIGVNVDIEEQVLNLEKACTPFQKEFLGNKIYKFATENGFGPGFGFIEAQALHAIIRSYKPAKDNRSWQWCLHVLLFKSVRIKPARARSKF